MQVSSPGVGSGLDIEAIVQASIAPERKALTDLGVERVELKTQLSATGKLRSTLDTFAETLSSLGSESQFLSFTARSSATDVLTAEGSEEAAKGQYALEVVRMAENHRMASTGVFADSDTTLVGTAGDTISIMVGTESFTVEIGGKTLEAIADDINSASDNTGVIASILQDDSGYHITLAADDTGSDNALNLTYNNADPFNFFTLNDDRDASGGFTTADLDAKLELEGAFTLTRSSNTITDAIAGVTLTLVDVGSSTVTVTRDELTPVKGIQSFIQAYNGVIEFLAELKDSGLPGERRWASGIEEQLRSVLQSPMGDSETFSRFVELGVTTKLDGTLELNSALFDQALAASPEAVADMFANSTNGLAARYGALVETLTDPNGQFDRREDAINAQIRSLERSSASLEARLLLKEERLYAKFSALDALLAGLNARNTALTQQLSTVTAINKQTGK